MRNGPYILILAPDDYPGKKYRGRYAYEHQVVWWRHTGQIVPVGFLIHHKNENKHDNSIDNLELKTVSSHCSEHAKEAEIIELICDWCDKKFVRKSRHHKSRMKIGYKGVYCCRSHQVSAQQAKRWNIIPR